MSIDDSIFKMKRQILLTPRALESRKRRSVIILLMVVSLLSSAFPVFATPPEMPSLPDPDKDFHTGGQKKKRLPGNEVIKLISEFRERHKLYTREGDKKGDLA